MLRLAGSRVIALTGFWSAVCLLALTLAVTIGWVGAGEWIITNLLKRSAEEFGLVAILGIVLAAGIGGAVWGRLVAPLVGARIRILMWLAGLAYGLAFPSIIAALGTFEGYITAHGAREATTIPNIHLLFVAAWSVGMVGLVGAVELALGIALQDERLALKLALGSGLAGAVGFIVLDAVMFMAGWRVGDPDFPERPTMTVVVLLGMLVAMAVGGAVQAWLVTRRQRVAGLAYVA